MQGMWVRSLGWEDPLEKEMANPLQYSCLENSVDRGAWQATVARDPKELDTPERLSAHAHSHPDLSGDRVNCCHLHCGVKG